MDDDGMDLFAAFDGEEVDENTKMELTSNMSAAAAVTSTNEGAKPAKKRKIKQEQPIETTERQLVSEMQTRAGAGGRNVKFCTAFPPGETSADIDPAIEKPFCGKEPAKVYKFELDAFQQRAVNCIELGHSVLVSAHTSAGKTACAEYAIAKSLKNGQRVIYTSPIKALSNQKYRDMSEEFEDVGLMTGDITINPSATCLIMTTEILRSMLYRGSEVMREVAWVIYDEIHYMRDKERGVVWEESIILLPHKVRFVFLSATIPNSTEFAKWIAKIHRQPCHVIYTEYRPTPLQHYIFPMGGQGLHLVVDEKGRFRDDNFQKAMSALGQGGGDSGGQEQGGAGGKGSGKKGSNKKETQKKAGQDLFRIVKMIMDRRYDPVIIFSFSKKECEAYATAMAKIDFNSPEEKELVQQIFENAMDSLSEDDRKLPQVEQFLPLLKRGVGIHHGGLLPILKEVIEILFQESLLKCLFATETFSMGINMPAKTVVFTNNRKFDGKDFRWITSGEYIQMSGRAGRRGLDSRGIVIQMLDEKMEPATCKSILYGASDRLESTFHLGYNMLLNLLRVEDANPEYMISKSFRQFQNEDKIPSLETQAVEMEEEKKKVKIEDEEEVATYFRNSTLLAKAKQDWRDIVFTPDSCLPFLNPGRLVRVCDGDTEWGWVVGGVVINFTRKKQKPTPGVASEDNSKFDQYVVDVLMRSTVEPMKDGGRVEPKPCVGGKGGEMRVLPLLLPAFADISSARIYLPKDLRPRDARQQVGISVSMVEKQFPHGLPLLDPAKDMSITDPNLPKVITQVVERIERATAALHDSPFHAAEDRDARYKLYKEKDEIDRGLRALRKEIRNTQTMVLKDDLKFRRRVLRRLGHTNDEDVISLKGRSACEISTADELVITELIFNGVFNEMKMEHTVALLSVFALGEKSKDEAVKVSEELAAPLRQLQEAARRVAKVCIESKLEIDEDEFVNSFQPDLMEVVLAWVKGAKFVEVMKLTEMFEGTIVRAIRRLEELLRQLSLAAGAIGNSELQAKFKEGGAAIKRDIVFAASLYL